MKCMRESITFVIFEISRVTSSSSLYIAAHGMSALLQLRT